MTEANSVTQVPDAVMQADNLPSLPAVAVDVLRLSRDENSGMGELAAAVGRDPALSTRLLRLANSARFNRGQEVTTVERATMVMGSKAVRLMSLGFSLASSLPRDGQGAFDHDGYWRRSLTTAVAAQSLARRVDSSCVDEAFLCGLLLDLGQLVLAHCALDLYAPVLEAAAGDWPSTNLEARLLGFDHGDVTGALLRKWELPALITQPINLVHQVVHPSDEPDPEVRALCEVLAVAQGVTKLAYGVAKGEALQRLRLLADEMLRFSEDAVDIFLLELEAEVAASASLLQIELPADTNHQALLDQARAQILDISLSATADLELAERRASTLEDRNRELHDKAHTDGLTGVANRAAFDAALAREVDSRTGTKSTNALGLLLFDLDEFKALNDTLGHQAGDHVLTHIGTLLTSITRSTDLCARYGGEEFVVMVPATTPGRLAIMARRLCEAIAVAEITWEGQRIAVTVSVGGACLATAAGADDAAALIKLADQQLYLAKERGRNRCEIDDEPMAPGW